MKKVIKVMAVFILWMTTAQVEASNASTFHVYAIGEKRFNVEVSNIRGEASSYIKSDDGQILFERKHKGEGALNVTFDISNLNEGTYLFIIEDVLMQQSVPFELTNDSVEIAMNEAHKIFFPQLIKENKQVIIKLLSNDSNDLSITIKSKDGQILFKERLAGKLGLIGRRFKFEKGDYLILLTSDDYSETKYLSF